MTDRYCYIFMHWNKRIISGNSKKKKKSVWHSV